MGKQEKIILRRIANTIIANLSTQCSGKLAISLFLYKYSEYVEEPSYEDTATILIKEVLSNIKKDARPHPIYSLVEIGVGLIRLIINDYLEDSDNSHILCKIDEVVFSDNNSITTTEIYSPTLYLIYRLKYYPKNFDIRYLHVFISHVYSYEDEDLLVFTKDPTPLCLILCLCMIVKNKYRNEIKGLTVIIDKIILSLDCYEKDLFYESRLAYYSLTMASGMTPKYDHIYSNICSFIDTIKYEKEPQLYYTDSWLLMLFNFKSISLADDLLVYIDEQLRDSFYDPYLSPLRLAGIGLLLLTNKNHKNEKIEFTVTD